MTRAVAKSFLFFVGVLFVAMFVVAVSGCATEPEIRTQIVNVPVEVKVAVREKCQAAMPKPPQWFTESPAAKDASWFDLSKLALSELEQSRIYVKELITELTKCL